MSSFSWLDYSESERSKVLDLINALGDRDTRDELGIGTVRDAYADLLAPGTSTIQTRARYFLFVPWVYRNVERRLRTNKATSKDEISKRLRNDEIRLINYLADSDDPDGTIGIDARLLLKRLPSSIYWNGLQAWGIRAFKGSQDQYNHALHAYGPPPPITNRGSDSIVERGNRLQNWHNGLPQAPKDFPYTQISFKLTLEEAEYLRERIIHSASGTLLSFLVDRGKPSKKVTFPWEHPQVGELSGKYRKPLQHAQNFSETIHGAALLYNHLLAKAAGHEEKIQEYEKKFMEWFSLIQDRIEILTTWDLDNFWQTAYSINPRIPQPTKTFIDTWLTLTRNTFDPLMLLNNNEAEDLIRTRERFLKRSQARLINPRSLELWGGAAGTSRLNYRWNTVQTFLADIQQIYSEDSKVA